VTIRPPAVNRYEHIDAFVLELQTRAAKAEQDMHHAHSVLRVAERDLRSKIADAQRERDEARAELDRRNADDRAVIERLNARREAATIDEAERAALVAALRAACDWAPLVDTRSFVVPIDAAVYVAHEHAAAERAARAEAEKLLLLAHSAIEECASHSCELCDSNRGILADIDEHLAPRAPDHPTTHEVTP
jgi:hypothetical protein